MLLNDQVGVLDWVQWPYASIGGTCFTSGEPLQGVKRAGWNNRRCGSLFTAVVGGVSRYGVIDAFITREDESGGGYAVVKWLPVPHYPYNHPLVVCLRDGDACGGLLSVISLTDIDPCGVCVERCDLHTSWYVYRLDGVDTVPFVY